MSVSLGTPLSQSAKKVLLCGAGELGKEVAIELQRLGVEVIAVDRYANAPAMQVAHRSHMINMLDGNALRQVIQQEQPDLIVPEIEAIATDTLADLQDAGYTVVPNARATQLTMNREGIRCLAAQTLGLKTSPFAFAATRQDYRQAIETIGLPCVVKPIMSSSGKGQSVVHRRQDIETAWACAQNGGRAGKGKVIIEGWVDFDVEITLLTIRHRDGTSFCAPIGHRQVDGDYQESWQPQPLSDAAWQQSQAIAEKITGALGGKGLFGVELFIKGDEAIFSEVSPRPHDTGLVTLVSQDLSEFALHVRAILDLPIPQITQRSPAASSVILAQGESQQVQFGRLEQALALPNTQLRLFGKPAVSGKRRMGIALAIADDTDQARTIASACAAAISISL